MCGDSTDFGQVSDLMDGKEADMVFTDPPYGMDLETDFSSIHKDGGTYDKVIGDNKPYDPAPIFEMFDSTKEIFLWGADYYHKKLPDIGSWIVWDKRANNAGMDLDKVMGSGFEVVWSKAQHKKELVRVLWSGHFGLEHDDTKERIHPTQKPIKLCGWFISKYSERGNNIVDLFGGSGSTLIACDKLERICYMAELSPAYCDVIRKRYHKFKTGSEDGWQEATPVIKDAVAQDA